MSPALIGGVVGGVAGLALLLLAILVLLKLRKQRRRAEREALESEQQQQQQRALPSGGMAAPVIPAAAAAAADNRSSRSSLPLPGFINRMRPMSQQTASTETGSSERGFYKVSGRKIAPALGSGGDGYQGTTLSETSFTRGGDDGGRLSPHPQTHPGSSGRGSAGGRPVSAASPPLPPPGSPLGPSGSLGSLAPGPGGAESGGDVMVVMRPSPARTPVTSPGPFGRFPSPPSGPSSGPSLRPLRGDGLGRSHPSQDGSRGSRFTENVE